VEFYIRSATHPPLAAGHGWRRAIFFASFAPEPTQATSGPAQPRECKGSTVAVQFGFLGDHANRELVIAGIFTVTDIGVR